MLCFETNRQKWKEWMSKEKYLTTTQKKKVTSEEKQSLEWTFIFSIARHRNLLVMILNIKHVVLRERNEMWMKMKMKTKQVEVTRGMAKHFVHSLQKYLPETSLRMKNSFIFSCSFYLCKAQISHPFILILLFSYIHKFIYIDFDKPS